MKHAIHALATSALGLALCLSPTLGTSALAAEELLWPTFRDVDQKRVDGWVRRGATLEDVEAVMERVSASSPPYRYDGMIDTQIAQGPGHWVYEWMQQGDAVLESANSLLQAGDTDAARVEFLRAAQLFNIGKAVYIRDEDWPLYEQSYAKAMEAYEAFGALLEVPLEIIEFPYRGINVRAYVHLPTSVAEAAVPVVIGSGGIDVFKTEAWPIARLLTEAGIAWVNIDMPGMGESNGLPNTPDHETAYLALLDALADDPRFDMIRAGAYATSWSGNAMARLALMHGERLAAVVSACGPFHAAINVPTDAIKEQPARMDRAAPPHRLDVLVDRLGVGLPRGDAENVALAELLPGYSLENQGLVTGDMIEGVPPFMVINDRNDPIQPLSDMVTLASAIEGATVVFTGDLGHCGTRGLIHERAAEFLARHLVPN